MDYQGGMRRRRRTRHGGTGIKDILSKINNFLRSTKIISSVGNALGTVGVPYASKIGSVAGTLGYGRRRRTNYRARAPRAMGYGLRRAGRPRRRVMGVGALRLAGGGSLLSGGRMRITAPRRRLTAF
jgi:hypothetical protein